jgi:hypothetical protein
LRTGDGDNAEEFSESSDETAPPAPQRKKEEGWKWSETRDKRSKLRFTGNPGIKPVILRNLTPEPNPFELMVHNSLWDEIAT